VAGEIVGTEIGLRLEDEMPGMAAIGAADHQARAEQFPRDAIRRTGEEFRRQRLCDHLIFATSRMKGRHRPS
jgi:hypothetical protein